MKDQKLKIAIAVFICIGAYALLSAGDHIVKKGETLYSISRSYGIPLDVLYKENNLSASYVLKADDVLYIPQAANAAIQLNTTYVVQAGDTLFSIARKNNLTVSEIRRMNNLKEDDLLKAGQTLHLAKTESGAKTSESKSAPAAASSTENRKSTEGASSERQIVSSAANAGVVWPVKKPVVSAVKGKISGVLLSAAPNEDVLSVSSGSVMYTGTARGYGQVVFVLGKTGYLYIYTGLGSVNVEKGKTLSFGDKLGTAGKDALTGENRLTFMVYRDGKPVDPSGAPRG